MSSVEHIALGYLTGKTASRLLRVEINIPLLFLILLWKTNYARFLLQGNKLSLLLTIPVFAVVLPAFLGFPMAVPVALTVPHLILLAILAIPIITGVKRILGNP